MKSTWNRALHQGFAMSWLEGKSNLDLYYAIEKGIPFRVFREVEAVGGMGHVELLGVLGISRRTFERRRRDQFKFGESERILRVLRLFAMASSVLDDADSGRRWMMRPHLDLGAERPIDLASTDAGGRAVEEALLRIEHGVYG